MTFDSDEVFLEYLIKKFVKFFPSHKHNKSWQFPMSFNIPDKFELLCWLSNFRVSFLLLVDNLSNLWHLSNLLRNYLMWIVKYEMLSYIPVIISAVNLHVETTKCLNLIAETFSMALGMSDMWSCVISLVYTEVLSTLIFLTCR